MIDYEKGAEGISVNLYNYICERHWWNVWTLKVQITRVIFITFETLFDFNRRPLSPLFLASVIMA